MSFSLFPLLVGLVLCCTTAIESVHLVNLTSLTTCDDYGMDPKAFITEVRHELAPDSGLCIALHATYNWTKVTTGAWLVKMLVFKCPVDTTGRCSDNSDAFEEILDCQRFKEDSSGPWHMYSSSMSGSKCGESIGIFTMDFSSLKIEHLVNYLDIDDEQFRRFRIKAHFIHMESNDTIGCNNIEFDLLKVTAP